MSDSRGLEKVEGLFLGGVGTLVLVTVGLLVLLSVGLGVTPSPLPLHVIGFVVVLLGVLAWVTLERR